MPGGALSGFSRGLRRLLAVAAVLGLSACGSVNMSNHGGTGADDITGAAPVDPVQSQPLAPPTGTPPSTAPGTPPGSGQLGSGPVKVALILPLTQNNAPS